MLVILSPQYAIPKLNCEFLSPVNVKFDTFIRKFVYFYTMHP